MNKKKLIKRYVSVRSSDVEGSCFLREITEALTRALSHGTKVTVGSDDYDIDIEFQSLETDEEFKRRVDKAKSSEALKTERELRQLANLIEKHGVPK